MTGWERDPRREEKAIWFCSFKDQIFPTFFLTRIPHSSYPKLCKLQASPSRRFLWPAVSVITCLPHSSVFWVILYKPLPHETGPFCKLFNWFGSIWSNPLPKLNGRISLNLVLFASCSFHAASYTPDTEFTLTVCLWNQCQYYQSLRQECFQTSSDLIQP